MDSHHDEPLYLRHADMRITLAITLACPLSVDNPVWQLGARSHTCVHRNTTHQAVATSAVASGIVLSLFVTLA